MATHTGPTAAGGLLNFGAVERLFRRFRLPRYGALAEACGDPEVRLIVRALRRAFADVFDAPETPLLGALECEDWLLANVERHLFPLDLEYINQMLYSAEESVLLGAVCFDAAGIPWEVCGMGNLPAGIEALYALTYRSLIPFAGINDVGELGDRLIETDDEVGEWLTDHDLLESAWGYPLILAALQALPAPFTGLAAGYRRLARQSGNTFIDTLPGSWIGEYGVFWGEESDYGWSPHDLRRLADEWAEVAPEAQAWHAYQDWYITTPGAEGMVIKTLCAALELALPEENDDDDDDDFDAGA
ncbi:MAG TPA: hypothetical protein PKH77_04980 [Anaerolineae bacterium]|nr:hypothetical protein [Anaerolineae bacterium]